MKTIYKLLHRLKIYLHDLRVRRYQRQYRRQLEDLRSRYQQSARYFNALKHYRQHLEQQEDDNNEHR